MANRRQHTIPQFYLRTFLSPGWVYRRGAFAPRATKNPVGVAGQRDYYGRDEATRNTLDGINSRLESEGAPVLKKLIEDPSHFTQDDWRILSYLFANFAVRTPAVIEEIPAAELRMITQLNVMAEKMKERLDEGLLRGGDLSEFSQSIPDDESPTMTLDEMNAYGARLQAEAGHRVTALGILSALLDVAQYIQQMRFLILEAPAGLFFVTSDRPLLLRSRVTESPVGAGWANPDSMASIVLCPSHFLLMFYAEPPGIQRAAAAPEDVAGLNLETIMFTNQEVYSAFEYPEDGDWMKGIGRWSPQRRSPA